MKFGDNLKYLRKNKKISQESLAELVNVSRQSVSKWERGESYPTMNNILELCKIFNCKLNYLVNENITDIDNLDEEVKMNVVKFKKEKQKKIKLLSRVVRILSTIGKITSLIVLPLVIIIMFLTPTFINNVNVIDDKLVFSGILKDVTLKEGKLKDGMTLTISENSVIENDDEVTYIKVKDFIKNHTNTEITIFVESGFLFLAINLIIMYIFFKYLEKLFKNIENGDTPFTLENVNYIKKMTYLMILYIILPNIGGLIFEVLLKIDLDIDFEVFSLIEILFLYSMSYIFEYGYEIQLDSKGRMYGEYE